MLVWVIGKHGKQDCDSNQVESIHVGLSHIPLVGSHDSDALHYQAMNTVEENNEVQRLYQAEAL